MDQPVTFSVEIRLSHLLTQAVLIPLPQRLNCDVGITAASSAILRVLARLGLSVKPIAQQNAQQFRERKQQCGERRFLKPSTRRPFTNREPGFRARLN
jgi:hypothetical protein